jgi:hypothetical protein
MGKRKVLFLFPRARSPAEDFDALPYVRPTHNAVSSLHGCADQETVYSVTILYVAYFLHSPCKGRGTLHAKQRVLLSLFVLSSVLIFLVHSTKLSASIPYSVQQCDERQIEKRIWKEPLVI